MVSLKLVCIYCLKSESKSSSSPKLNGLKSFAMNTTMTLIVPSTVLFSQGTFQTLVGIFLGDLFVSLVQSIPVTYCITTTSTTSLFGVFGFLEFSLWLYVGMPAFNGLLVYWWCIPFESDYFCRPCWSLPHPFFVKRKMFPYRWSCIANLQKNSTISSDILEICCIPTKNLCLVVFLKNSACPAWQLVLDFFICINCLRSF